MVKRLGPNFDAGNAGSPQADDDAQKFDGARVSGFSDKQIIVTTDDGTRYSMYFDKQDGVQCHKRGTEADSEPVEATPLEVINVLGVLAQESDPRTLSYCADKIEKLCRTYGVPFSHQKGTRSPRLQ